MMKPLNGSWFEFQHHSEIEGTYWNAECLRFTGAQWREKVREMKGLGMTYIVLLATSLVRENGAESYYPDGVFPLPKGMVCLDPMDALMDEAEKAGMRVFVSAGFYGDWTRPDVNMVSPEVEKRAFGAMEAIYARYGKYKSFYGWYFPDETCISHYMDEAFVQYVNRYAAFGRGFDKNLRALIAPYGTNMLVADDQYIAQLERLDADFVAYQDEIGVRKSTPDQTGAYYAALKKAHDKAGRAKLWADVELFAFEGDVYKSALIPPPIERLIRQLEAVSPYCEELLGYQYLGMMNPPGSAARCGHADSERFYTEYKERILYR